MIPRTSTPERRATSRPERICVAVIWTLLALDAVLLAALWLESM